MREIIVLDSNGVSQFNSLLSRKGGDTAVFYAFDLIWLNHTDCRGLPLVERKQRLHDLVQKSQCQRLLYAQHIETNGKKFFEEICRRDLEGVVAKRKAGLYRDDRDPHKGRFDCSSRNAISLGSWAIVPFSF